MGRVSLPPDWPAVQLARELPPGVRENEALLGRLAQHVYTVMHLDDLEGPAWEEPKARDLRAVAAAVRRLEGALGRVHPSLVENATMHARVTRAELLEALALLRDEADHWLAHRGARRPGTKPDSRRRYLEAAVAHELRGAGIRLTKYRGGVLAQTLLVCLAVAGLSAPEADSLLPTLQRLVGR